MNLETLPTVPNEEFETFSMPRSHYTAGYAIVKPRKASDMLDDAFIDLPTQASSANSNKSVVSIRLANNLSTGTASPRELSRCGSFISINNNSSYLSPTYKKILNLYNVDLSINTTYHTVSKNIGYIVEELTELPQGFVEKLNLRIVLTNDSEVVISSWFHDKDLTSKEATIDKFYSVLFDFVVTKYPSIISSWPDQNNESEKLGNQLNTAAKIHDIQGAFSAIMQNKPYHKSKADIVNLKNMLIDLQSRGFTAEWFKYRNHQLKKDLRVTFNVNDKPFKFPLYNKRSLNGYQSSK